MHEWVLIIPDGNNPGDAKKRKGKAVKEGQVEPDSKTQNGTKQLTFDLQCLKSVQTDFEKDGGFQKAVRFSPDHTLVVTGGADGFLRVWKVLLLHSLSIFLLAFFTHLKNASPFVISWLTVNRQTSEQIWTTFSVPMCNSLARNFETSLNLHLFVLIFAWWGILNRVKPTLVNGWMQGIYIYQGLCCLSKICVNRCETLRILRQWYEKCVAYSMHLGISAQSKTDRVHDL